ncbi:MAG: transporter permease [Hydrocarboniphaga sp.]|uniref:ABC transporter permease n=1 Tax=Hydrocarboniphaga sp. TaxID=2033016 RepID=UPI002633A3EA|nr:ABC transporter permease [Hydrocarboniphaga sp.]MDB5972840.1 transporter permease [Hydrocarboniphaga sp.]
MFGYYLRLGLRQLRRSPVLTSLVILTLAVGVAASMSTLTVLYMMSADPIPQKSDRLLTVTLDNAPADSDSKPEDIPRGLSWLDVKALREGGKGLRRSGMYGTGGIVEPQKSGVKNFVAQGIAVDRDFFAMMDVDFKFGSAWRKEDDRDEARVVVISRAMSQKLYGDESPLGRTIKFNNGEFRIVGVLGQWHMLPRFYLMENGRRSGGSTMSDEEEIFLPLSTAIATEQDINGNVNCQSDAAPGYKGLVVSECTFMHYWVELASASDRSDYREYLHAYVGQQKARGRLPRPDQTGLYNVRDWLSFIGVVDDDTRLQTWLAFGFLSVCLVNTIGLLLAKFTSRSGEIGVRRALGASRAQIFAQYLLEAAVLGLVGSVLGVVLAYGMLHIMATQSPDLAALAKMDSLMLLTTVLLSVAAAVLAGLLPTWRATQVVPALQLKSQ